MKSRQKTTVAVLRTILGSITGNEQTFAALVEMSAPWVNKVSSGALKLTPKTAQKVSQTTGVSAEWLLQGDPATPPVECDNKTRYTRQSYDRHVETTFNPSKNSEQLGIAVMMASTVKSLQRSLETGKISTAKNDLWEFTQMLKGKYGMTGDRDACLTFSKEIQGEVEQILCWNRAV